MKSLDELLDEAKKAHKLDSDSALGRALGVKRQTVSNWRKGHNFPDEVACAALAGLTGEPLARVLGIVGEARATSREAKAVWRKLAASAVALLIACFSIPSHAAYLSANGSMQPENSPKCALCEVLRRMGRWLVGTFLDLGAVLSHALARPIPAESGAVSVAA